MFGSSLKNDLKPKTRNMASEVIQTGQLKSEEGAHITQKRNGRSRCQCNSSCSHGSERNLPPKRVDDIHCHEQNCDQTMSQPPSGDAAHYINGGIQPDTIPKRLRHQKEMTFQDIYREEYDDDDEDEDSDWEPSQGGTKKWFCTNCTMVNFDDVLHCDICGEYKDTAILRHGFFASSTAQEAEDAQFNSEVRDRHKDLSKGKPSTDSRTAVGFDERMLLHSEMEMKSQPHPERPDRLRAITASLSIAGIFPGRCFPVCGREITKEELERVHSQEHIEAVELSSSMVSSYFTPDTYANEHSAFAARLAAGLCADLSSAIMGGHAKNGFALVRPPGHHAGVKQVMGFCLHNNAAVAALAAQRANAKKVLIVDWDVHHGNGTQEIFEANTSVLYISLHRHEGGRFYPGTGAANEVGVMGAEGYCVNIPWRCGGVGDNDYIFAFQQIVLPIASEFAPDLTIISAGFDAARGDPLGCCDVTPAGFARMTHLLTTLSNGRLLVILEGGYNLRSISSSATAVIKVLLGEIPQCELGSTVPSKAGVQTVMEVLQIQMKFWPKLESNLTKLLLDWPSLSFQHQNIKNSGTISLDSSALFLDGQVKKSKRNAALSKKPAGEKERLEQKLPIIPRKDAATPPEGVAPAGKVTEAPKDPKEQKESRKRKRGETSRAKNPPETDVFARHEGEVGVPEDVMEKRLILLEQTDVPLVEVCCNLATLVDKRPVWDSCEFDLDYPRNIRIAARQVNEVKSLEHLNTCELHSVQGSHKVGEAILKRFVGATNERIRPAQSNILLGNAGFSLLELGRMLVYMNNTIEYLQKDNETLTLAVDDYKKKEDARVAMALKVKTLTNNISENVKTIDDQRAKISSRESDNQTLKAGVERLKQEIEATLKDTTRIAPATKSAIIGEFRAFDAYRTELHNIAKPMFEEGGFKVLRFLFGNHTLSIYNDGEAAAKSICAHIFDDICEDGHSMVPYTDRNLEACKRFDSGWDVLDVLANNLRVRVAAERRQITLEAEYERYKEEAAANQAADAGEQRMKNASEAANKGVEVALQSAGFTDDAVEDSQKDEVVAVTSDVTMIDAEKSSDPAEGTQVAGKGETSDPDGADVGKTGTHVPMKHHT